MAIAIGTDILEVARIAKISKRQGRKFAERILTENEMVRWDEISHQDVKNAYLAKRFSAKEAIAKALGTGISKGIGWQQIEISNLPTGAPVVSVSGAAYERLAELNGKEILISISDEQYYVVAFCVIN